MGATIITFVLALALITTACVFLYSGVNEFLVQNSRLSRRLNPGASSNLVKEEALVPDEGIIESVEKYITPDDPDTISAIQRKLLLAGYRNSSAVQTYFLWKWGIAIAGFLFACFFLAATMTRLSPFIPLSAMIIIVFVSYFLADMWVLRKAAYRKIAIENAFPDALDLLLVCIEAGHGLDQAIHRVAGETKKSSAELSQELSQIVSELRAGKDRDKVLSDFSDRTGVTDIAAFVTVIKQADLYGVSIADTLRVYSREMRNKRYMKAEEKANMMPIKLALGAIAFTIPPVIMILIGPSVVLVLREMAKAATVG
ncbi:MAG: pilus assembly protein TadC [Hyphococcus sp.]|nr:MAG: pilus assembly protein TadC [Marinicaulis sp.]